MIRRAKERVLDSFDENYAEGFQLVAPFMDGLQRLNPGTVTSVERDAEGRFERLFLMMGQHVKVCAHMAHVMGVQNLQELVAESAVSAVAAALVHHPVYKARGASL